MIVAKETVRSRKMSKGNVCTPARRSSGGPAHQVVKSVEGSLLFSKIIFEGLIGLMAMIGKTKREA